MRVAIIKSPVQQPGGLEKVAQRITDGFRARGAQIVQTMDADIVFAMDRSPFQTHLRAGNGSHWAYLQSRKLSEGWLKYWSCLINPRHRKILALERKAFEDPTLKKLFVNSHMVERQILERYHVDPKKVVVVHNGVEWSELEAKGKTGPFTFLFIGHGFTRKGLRPLLEGMRLLNNPPQLLVIGKDKHEAKFRALARGLPVEFLGAQANVRPFYSQADALVIPSFYDPFANVTVEALAQGLFVVSSKFNGGSEVLTRENGTVIQDLLSPPSIKQALEIAMQHPKTQVSAAHIRESVKHLDYSIQLKTLLDACYE